MNLTDSASASTEPNALPQNGVWYFSGDLLFASRVKFAAESAGLPFSLLGKWPESPPSQPLWIIVDLATRAGGAAAIAALAKQQNEAAQFGLRPACRHRKAS